MRRLPGSIGFNLVLVVLAGVLPVLAVVLGSGYERRAHEIDTISLTTLRLAQFYAYEQIAEANRLRAVLSAAATEKVVLNRDAAACGVLFRDMLLANPHYVNFALAAPDGEVLASALPFSRENLGNRKEFREALRKGNLAVGEYSRGRVSGVPILPFAYPVRDAQGAVVAVLIATQRLQDLGTSFDQSLMPTDSFVVMADHDGCRLYNYPPFEKAVVGDPLPSRIWSKMAPGEPRTIFTETGMDGLRRIFAVSHVSLDDGAPYLSIFVAIPERDALDQADMVTGTLLAWLSGSLLLSLCLAWLVGRLAIHAPLERLTRTAKRIGEGDLEARSGLIPAGGALGTLARSMDRMAENLASDRDALVQALESRDQEVQRRAALMDTSPDGIVIIDKDHRVVEANRRFAEMLGYTPEEIVGLRTWAYEATLSEAEIRSRFPMVVNILITFETRHKRKDGTTFPVEVSASGSRIFGQELLVAIVRDITERKLAEQALQESEERYRALFEHSQDAIALREGEPARLTWVNPSFCRLFDYTAEEIQAMPEPDLWALVHPDDREAARRSITQQFTEWFDTSRLRLRVLTKAGECRWVDGTGRLVRGSNDRMIMFMLRDVTEEQETRALLESAKAHAEAASRAKSEFLANMSHEIRTPLNGIVGMLQLLKLSGLDTELAGYVQMALQASQRLTRLLSDILDLSRIEAGKMPFVHEPFDVRDTVLEIRELLLPLARQSGIDCGLFVDPRLPRIVIGDAARLQQLLTNLVGNALKFTRAGQVAITVSRLPAPDESRCRLLFSVADTGVGIPEATLPHLFEPFTQSAHGHRRDHPGAGLGLAICRRLVDLMGGDITLESEVGAGTTVTFSLPFGLPDAPQRPGPRPDAEPAGGCRGLSVLLAEDDALTRTAMRLLLERAGHAVTPAENGRAALDALAAKAVDVILMDIQMPVMDGLEATRRIRAGEAGPERAATPVIAMTAYAMAEDRERFLAAGLDGHIAKPVDAKELFGFLERFAADRATGGTPPAS